MRYPKRMTILLALTLLAVGAAWAQPGGGWGAQPSMGGGRPDRSSMGGPGGHGPSQLGELQGIQMMLRMLDITEQQREEIRGIFEETREEVRSILETADHSDIRRRVGELFTQKTLTVSELEAVFAEADEVREEVRTVVLEAVVRVHDVLTDEQLERLAELLEQRPAMEGPGPGF